MADGDRGRDEPHLLGVFALISRADMARRIDHTLLRAHATEAEVRQLCVEAAEHGFRAVSVNPAWVTFCAKLLRETHVVVDACVAFPLGAATARMKVEEAKEAVQNGARELDMVINLGALKSGYPDFVEREIAAVSAAVKGVPLKVILETGCLNRDEKIMVCEMAVRAGAAFVKTATGFGPGGATVEDVALMRETVGERLGVKAAGGVRTWGGAVAMLQAGASVVGTSAGVAILSEGPENPA
jgi:deoxyribose-phosphate aldolase